MNNILTIDLTELKSLKLSLNEYLTLLLIEGTVTNFNWAQRDLDKLVILQYLVKIPTGKLVLSPKSVAYFQALELFNEFYQIFPHTVQDKFGDSRPLRAATLETQAAAVTKSIWRKRVKGNVQLQNKIIEVLKAEINWRTNNNSLQFMNNIDTWLRQSNWEKYEYLLNNDEEITGRRI